MKHLFLFVLVIALLKTFHAVPSAKRSEADLFDSDTSPEPELITSKQDQTLGNQMDIDFENEDDTEFYDGYDGYSEEEETASNEHEVDDAEDHKSSTESMTKYVREHMKSSWLVYPRPGDNSGDSKSTIEIYCLIDANYQGFLKSLEKIYKAYESKSLSEEKVNEFIEAPPRLIYFPQLRGLDSTAPLQEDIQCTDEQNYDIFQNYLYGTRYYLQKVEDLPEYLASDEFVLNAKFVQDAVTNIPKMFTKKEKNSLVFSN